MKKLMIIARPNATDSRASWNRPKITPPVMTARTTPLARPTTISRVTVRTALNADSSRLASARTATVRVWVPALPPSEATTGMRAARMASFSI